jgi:hypothetical protein
MEYFLKWDPKKDSTGSGCQYWKRECHFQFSYGKLRVWVLYTYNVLAIGLEGLCMPTEEYTYVDCHSPHQSLDDDILNVVT